MSEILTSKEEKQERKRLRQKHRLATFRRLAQQEDLFLDECITTAEDERTILAKKDVKNRKKKAIDAAHTPGSTPMRTPGYAQRARNAKYTATTALHRAFGKLFSQKRVSFRLGSDAYHLSQAKSDGANSVLITYDSGADGHYISEADRKKAGMPILRKSAKQVRVANGDISKAKNVTKPRSTSSPQRRRKPTPSNNSRHR
jgi:hypothetical protein